jgi:hypothetical protein
MLCDCMESDDNSELVEGFQMYLKCCFQSDSIYMSIVVDV